MFCLSRSPEKRPRDSSTRAQPPAGRLAGRRWNLKQRILAAAAAAAPSDRGHQEKVARSAEECQERVEEELPVEPVEPLTGR